MRYIKCSSFGGYILQTDKMRRGVGMGAIQKKKETEAKYKEKGSEMASEQLQQLTNQLSALSERLEIFAAKHRNEIRQPELRRQFQQMCAAAGVDPLASSKGFWASKLGVGDFYYELAVQVVEVCMATSHRNGGILSLEELRSKLMRSRSKAKKEDISNEDIICAISKLKCLGSGFQLIKLSDSQFLIQSVPGEVSMDQARVLQLAQESAWVSIPKLCSRYEWEEARASRVLEQLLSEGFAWLDTQSADGENRYWFPSLFTQLLS